MPHRKPYKAKISYIIRDSTADDLYRFRRIYARQATVLANSYVESDYLLKLAYSTIEAYASMGEYKALGVRLTQDSMHRLQLDGFSVQVNDLTDKNVLICTIWWPGDIFVEGGANEPIAASGANEPIAVSGANEPIAASVDDEPIAASVDDE